jgi:hypothetical protein
VGVHAGHFGGTRGRLFGCSRVPCNLKSPTIRARIIARYSVTVTEKRNAFLVIKLWEQPQLARAERVH